MTVLVVGANGQLGARCCRVLAAQGYAVRGSVRDRARAAGLDLGGADVVEVDLTGGASLDPLLDGVDSIVLTANSAVPRAGDDPGRFHDALVRLVDVAGTLGVQRVVLPSLPVTPVDAKVPMTAERRRLEEEVRSAVAGSVILRFPPFMECWLALVGSSLPLRGEPNATIGRPSPFLRRFRRATGSVVEQRGIMLVPGPTSRRQAFIAQADAAAACVAAIGRPELAGRTLDVGGPEVLTWDDVAGIFSRLLGRPVRAALDAGGRLRRGVGGAPAGRRGAVPDHGAQQAPRRRRRTVGAGWRARRPRVDDDRGGLPEGQAGPAGRPADRRLTAAAVAPGP